MTRSIVGTILREKARARLLEIRTGRIAGLERELSALRARCAQLEQERDILQDQLRAALARVAQHERSE